MRFAVSDVLGRSLMSVVVLLVAADATADVVDFEDLTPTTPYTGPGDGYYWNGSDSSGGFTSGGMYFKNTFVDWGGGNTSWDGWAYSNTTDTTTAEYTNQYSAYTGGAYSGSNYAVYFEPWSLSPTITLAPGTIISGAYITNTTYAALSMLNGDPFAKKFGGTSGDDPDWFKLTITGLDALDNQTGTVDFYLADYRFDNNAQDYIIDQWTWVDLSGLGNATMLAFHLDSTDVGTWGMNTPAYFAIDNITTSSVPEPSTLVILTSGLLVLGAAGFLRAHRPG